ncbi:MAG: fatty acid desaturase [Acidobacteriaceae bacterium]|nr:fatty acid desaturase [Acidobacteriaceae bacterium]
MSLIWMAVITFVILQMSVFITTIYLHRAITHRGVELHPVVVFLMHLELMLFTGIVPRQWAAVHRKHHHHSDEEGDPHSPRVLGLWTVLLGNYFLYRKEANNPATVRKYTPDYRRDPLDRLPIFVQNYSIFVGLAIFMLFFGWAWGLAAWLVNMLLYVLLNSSINSLCHMIGYRNFDNLATNITIVALFTGGEGLHNNHHEFPTSARFAMRGKEIDLAWPVIRLLERCGLARINRLPIAKAA